MAFLESLNWRKRLSYLSRRSTFQWAIALAMGTILTLSFFLSDLPAGRRLLSSFQSTSSSYRPTNTYDGSWNTERDRDNLFLDRSRCRAAFPGLFDDIDRLVADRRSKPITITEMENLSGQEENWMKANTRDHAVGYIDNGNIHVTSYRRSTFSRALASVHALHRAVITAPEPIPDIVFNLLPGDSTKNASVWGLCRHMGDNITWLMPDFGFWAWPEPGVGSYIKVQQEAREMEQGVPVPRDALEAASPESPAETATVYTWANKIPKLVWRGAVYINEYQRKKLMDVAKDQPWADVRDIVWTGPGKPPANLLSVSEFCKYKYIMYVEGHAYSGALRSQQNCRSVIVAPPLNWTTHYQHLMRRDGPGQNYVEVAKDFGNLAETIAWLEQNPEAAERIADNSARTFRDRYISRAAEACYWRELVHGWAEVSEKPRIWERRDGKWKRRGAPFEDVVLMGEVEWENF
ncbi:glycosyl transferase family 90-domain-containing protein [Hypoxylon cercidicola]|nr:glycosyl transferase family 90-domain-containing protein [Hypoxylon cercidicola]